VDVFLDAGWVALGWGAVASSSAGDRDDCLTWLEAHVWEAAEFNWVIALAGLFPVLGYGAGLAAADAA
jgi:hypothetical protein